MSGISIPPFMPLHPLKAPSPIVSNKLPSAKVRNSNFLQSLKALAPMLVTVYCLPFCPTTYLGIVTSFISLLIHLFNVADWFSSFNSYSNPLQILFSFNEAPKTFLSEAPKACKLDECFAVIPPLPTNNPYCTKVCVLNT